jgi:hypothetical protein
MTSTSAFRQMTRLRSVFSGNLARVGVCFPRETCEGLQTTLLSQSGHPNCMRPRGAQRTFLGPIKGGICVIVSRSGQNSGP